jgi:hypothetical protein
MSEFYRHRITGAIVERVDQDLFPTRLLDWIGYRTPKPQEFNYGAMKPELFAEQFELVGDPPAPPDAPQETP